VPVDARMYSCNFTGTAATVAVDFFELTPADDRPCIVHAVYLGQSTETGDAAEEMLPIEIHRGGTAITTGSGGVAAAAGVALSGAQTSGFTFEAMNTTAASFTGGVVVHRDTFNVRTGWQYIPTPETQIMVGQNNGGLVVRLGAAPADSITWWGTMIVEEIGTA
jgi:hypothetical protein